MTLVKSSEFKKIDSDFFGTFKNMSYKNKLKHNTGYKYDNLRILNLLEVNNQNIDSINLSFIAGDSLLIKYSDSTGIRIKKFNGRFSKRGFYEIYFRKEKIEIPPLFPIIYSRVNTNRVRISLSNENELLII